MLHRWRARSRLPLPKAPLAAPIAVPIAVPKDKTITSEIPPVAAATLPVMPPPPPPPAPRTAASDKTISIGPEITIPGLSGKLKIAPTAPPKAAAPIDSPQADQTGPMPASPSDFSTMAIEQPQHGGVGPAVKVPLPKPEGDPNGTMRIEPTQSPDATMKMKPHPQEPA